MKTVVIIPALDPPDTLCEYISALKNKGFFDIILVDDGSSDKSIFSACQKQGANVLTHPVNLGKGAALKNAFKYYLDNYNTGEFAGVITADSDGQHLADDLVKIQDAMAKHPGTLVLGCRDFSLPHVPPKSKYGNNLTKGIFKHLLRFSVSDTQTGLRGIPNALIKPCLDIPGDRFEYETSMLIKVGKPFGIFEVPIETVYLDANSGTHFNPVKDSIKIYMVIFGTFIRYLLSSGASFIVDIFLFALFSKVLLQQITNRIFLATFFARIISSGFNYTLNKKMVFNSKDNPLKSGTKYACLVIAVMLISGGLVTLLSGILPIDEVIVKIFVDTVLFVCNYLIQKHFIFKN